MLAAELSVAMDNEYSVAQDKALSNPSKTGNAPSAPLPLHYDAMLEYWSDKNGFRKESLMSTNENEMKKESECDEEVLRDRKE
ncbi:hypothetical protein H257_00260 [Aphanomyces astaci]|uniref:Uncharacterized protein n=1 Tax=Aphanomyces astaci TaxID=112090 RepID=W4HB03_APHAT|nr:hypothetical protein H257_00260 [Aphanomyces astaci]ETV88746.1 hypothetical protein H257_00260 [Aphanomyces astaci]|eukprot:XP_009821146.1 hypothetical protein H257_00260 [Aphanomyces astaci]